MLSHALEGLASEVGEVADAIKKYKRYGKVLDRQNIREEIGDLLYYASMAMDSIDDSLELAAMDNVAKLKVRYPEGFSEHYADARLDKNDA